MLGGHHFALGTPEGLLRFWVRRHAQCLRAPNDFAIQGRRWDSCKIFFPNVRGGMRKF